MRSERFIPQLLIAAAVICAVGCRGSSAGSFPTCNLPFTGTASGGTLVLAAPRNRNQAHVSIVTFPGESAESVARRLAEAINALNQSPPSYGTALWGGGFQAHAEGGTVTLPGGINAYAIAGTEKGLGIPKAPVSLSCSYDKTDDKVQLRWINPPGGYDSIFVKCYWTNLDHAYSKRVAGTTNSFIIDRTTKPVDVNDFDAYVVGVRDAVPSNSAGIHLSSHCQGEIYGIPFAGGVAPNWTAWSSGAPPEATAFKQERKYLASGWLSTLSSKPFHQVIKAPPKGAVHGIYRKFLGLTAGHTYRLIAGLSTLKMDGVKGPWSLSVCAAANRPGGSDLTAEQLAGLVALPDGGKGPEAGRIAFYSQDNTTDGKYAIALSGRTGPYGLKSSHITLPSGVDTITVWVRFSCSDPNGKVAFSGVKLEDITASRHVKSARAVILEEVLEESSLLERDAKIRARYGIDN